MALHSLQAPRSTRGVPDWLTKQPLFFRNAFEVPISLLIESLVANVSTFDDAISLSHCNDCEKFDIEINCDRHQVGILLALDDLSGTDLSGLGEMQFCFYEQKFFMLHSVGCLAIFVKPLEGCDTICLYHSPSVYVMSTQHLGGMAARSANAIAFVTKMHGLWVYDRLLPTISTGNGKGQTLFAQRSGAS